MSLNPGDWVHLVLVQNAVRTPDGDGGYSETWTNAAPPTWRAGIRSSTALERSIAGSVQTQTSHVVAGPYHAEVTTRTRLVFGTRFLYVRGVNNVGERNTELVLQCEEVTP